MPTPSTARMHDFEVVSNREIVDGIFFNGEIHHESLDAAADGLRVGDGYGHVVCFLEVITVYVGDQTVGVVREFNLVGAGGQGAAYDSGDKKAEASVTITKDAQGNVTGANATVSGSKGTLTTDVVKQLTEAAGTEDLTITVQVKNANGDVKYTVSVSAENVKNNKSLKAFVVNRKTGEYELINSKTYKAKDGKLNASFGKKGDYVLLTTKEAARIEKEILKTIAPKKAKATVKKGKTTEFKLDSKLNQNNVKKVTYKTSKKSIATVNKNGKIKANRKGTVTIKATVTLKNGKTKTVSMKIVVR